MVKVSVIIPTYGDPVFLQPCIESVLRQTLSDFELIIVDDNNPETPARGKTEELVRKFTETDGRIRYIQHDHNRNGAVARNTGFAVAEGEYIALLDSDDEYLPDRLEKCSALLDRCGDEIAGVYTGCEYRKAGRKVRSISQAPSGNFLKETLACKFHFYTGSNIFVRKRVVDELNGFDPTFLRHQDYEFLVRVFGKYSLTGIPEVLVIKNNENVNVPDIDRLRAIKEQYLAKYQGIIGQLSKEDQDYIYFCHYTALAEAAMAQKRYALGREFYAEAGRRGNLTARIWLRRIVYPFYNVLIKR